ncbi:MAG: GSU2403 family nucleotidyltransferase fold protein [Candidatus Omnitrophica bacterium]|nr:GSU2403 family nucleotidyltransferase fold protein [Candidatus Omnitrophota bacterium]
MYPLFIGGSVSLLTQRVINAEVEGVKISLPHPAVFAFHKLIVAQIRKNKDKKAEDKEQAVRILRALIDKGELATTKKFLNCMFLKWQAKALASLKEMGELELLGVLK